MVDVISVHISKTAGSAFHAVMNQVYRPEQIAYDYDDRPTDPTCPSNCNLTEWERRTEEFVRRLSPKVRILHGHFSAFKYKQFFPQARVITWLRHPVSRLISHYFYWKSLPPKEHVIHRALWERKLSFEEFAEIPHVQNIVARFYFRGFPLSKCAFVGIQEQYEQSLQELRQTLRWPRLKTRVVNENQHPGYREAVQALWADAAPG